MEKEGWISVSKEVKERVLVNGWRCLMQATRDAAIVLAKAGKIMITQKGIKLDPNKPFKGIVRLRMAKGE